MSAKKPTKYELELCAQIRYLRGELERIKVELVAEIVRLRGLVNGKGKE